MSGPGSPRAHRLPLSIGQGTISSLFSLSLSLSFYQSLFMSFALPFPLSLVSPISYYIGDSVVPLSARPMPARSLSLSLSLFALIYPVHGIVGNPGSLGGGADPLPTRYAHRSFSLALLQDNGIKMASFLSYPEIVPLYSI